jgi:PPE-repeat protein
MDFGLLPPEVNSARIYAGPGSAPMLAAGASWDSLAAELSTTAEAYGSVLLSLTTVHWRGPASVSMQTAAAAYMHWLHTTAEQARQTAIQARAAAAAFEQAHAMTVPPPLVAANRARLSVLLATNVLGQNTAAIAATEAEYVEMWAQDVAAMYGYAAGSAAAMQLTPFTPPEQTTNPAGLAAQSAAVTKAVSASASGVQSQLSRLGTEVSRAAGSAGGLLGEFLLGDIDAMDAIYSAFTGMQTCQQLVIGLVQTGRLTGLGAMAPAGPAHNLFPPIPAINALQGNPGSRLGIVGGASRIGPLAVPASWAVPSGAPISPLSGAGLTTLPGTDELAGAGMPGVPFVSSQSSRPFGTAPRYGTHLTVMSRPPAAG